MREWGKPIEGFEPKSDMLLLTFKQDYSAKNRLRGWGGVGWGGVTKLTIGKPASRLFQMKQLSLGQAWLVALEVLRTGQLLHGMEEGKKRPFTELQKTKRGEGFGRNFSNSVLDMLILRMLIEHSNEMSIRQMDIQSLC